VILAILNFMQYSMGSQRSRCTCRRSCTGLKGASNNTCKEVLCSLKFREVYAYVRCEFIYGIDGHHPRSLPSVVNRAPPSMTLLITCNSCRPAVTNFGTSELASKNG